MREVVSRPRAGHRRRARRADRARAAVRGLGGALALAGLAWTAGCARDVGARAPSEPAAERWIQLFDGRDLDGWIPKITHLPMGENFARTFRVEDGLLRVAYDGYGEFGGRFGHLFFETPFHHYRLRVEYRFHGQQAPGGPAWALRNSGVMLHCQSPESMALDQEFPVSIEAQMLGGDGTNERHTGNLCTPGTHVVLGGELVTRHCTDSTSRTYHGDQWVTLEVEVRGGELIRHWMEGEVVLEYGTPQLDEGDADAQRLLAGGAPKLLEGGWIALQSESHPIDFRKVEILPLE